MPKRSDLPRSRKINLENGGGKEMIGELEKAE